MSSIPRKDFSFSKNNDPIKKAAIEKGFAVWAAKEDTKIEFNDPKLSEAAYRRLLNK